jgi:hypothetical protein
MSINGYGPLGPSGTDVILPSNPTFETVTATDSVTADTVVATTSITTDDVYLTNADIDSERATYTDSSKRIKTGATTYQELQYVNGVTSAIQDQLNHKVSTYATDATYWDTTPTASSTLPVTSGGLYTEFATKQNTITGAATTITSSNLTASCVLVSDSSGKVAVKSTVSDTEVGYLDGVTSAIQTQFTNKVSKYSSDSSYWDTTPTASSTKACTSGGIKTYVDNLVGGNFLGSTTWSWSSATQNINSGQGLTNGIQPPSIFPTFLWTPKTVYDTNRRDACMLILATQCANNASNTNVYFPFLMTTILVEVQDTGNATPNQWTLTHSENNFNSSGTPPSLTVSLLETGAAKVNITLTITTGACSTGSDGDYHAQMSYWITALSGDITIVNYA